MRLTTLLSLALLLNVVPGSIGRVAAQDEAVTTNTVNVGVPPAPPPAVYHASCQAGFSLAEGNTSNRSVASGCDASREGKAWLFSLKGTARYGNNRFGGPKYPGGLDQPRGDFILVENNFYTALRQDRFLTRIKSQYVFLVESYAGDQFKGFWSRAAVQGGYGYAFLNAENTKLKAEAGVEYSHDRLVEPNPNGSLEDDRMAAVLTLLGEKAFNDYVAANGLVSYSRNLEDGRDYRVKAEAGVIAKLSGAISFKTAGVLNYENLPKLVEPLDKTGVKIAGAPAVPARKTDVSLINLLVVSIY